MKAVTSFTLPPFYCPIPTPLHPRAEQLEQRAIAWMDEIGLYHHEIDRAWGIATHAFDHVCRTCPHAPDEALLLHMEWMYWGFAVDDTTHDAVKTSRTADVVDFNMRVLRCLESPGSPVPIGTGELSDALADLVVRTRAAASPTQFQRLIDGIRDWLFAVAWQTSIVERGVTPTLADYGAIRPRINGARFHIAMIEIDQNTEVPTDLLHSLPMRAAIEASNFIVSIDNDLFGYVKDRDEQAAERNLLDLLLQERGYSLGEAVAEAAGLRDQAVTLLLALSDRLAHEARADLRLLLDSLRGFAFSSVLWHSTTPRYASPRGRHARPVPGAHFDIIITDTPCDVSLTAPPIPTIAWWWDQRRPG